MYNLKVNITGDVCGVIGWWLNGRTRSQLRTERLEFCDGETRPSITDTHVWGIEALSFLFELSFGFTFSLLNSIQQERLSREYIYRVIIC